MKNILLIDDDNISNFISTKVIERVVPDANVEIALSANQALSILSNQEQNGAVPDVILLDLNMPVMDGFDFLGEFSRMAISKERKTRICILSSSLNTKDAERARNLGATDYVIKPPTVEQLEHILCED